MNGVLRSRLSRVRTCAFVIGVAALALAGWGAWRQPKQFFFSYLFGWMFWLGLSLGCLLVAMIHQLTGGRWGYPTRRFLEAGFLALPLMLVLFIPVFFGLRELYPWARPAEVSIDPVLQWRHGYQNTAAFIARTIVFMGIWIWMASRLRRWSLDQDATPDATPTLKSRALSGVGVVVFGLLGTFACVDWLMSLEPHWHSTMFPVIVIIGQVLLTYAFAVIALSWFRGVEPLANAVTNVHFHHLGNLLLAFVLFWTYVSFGQFLIIYSGDLPNEVDWYRHRIAGNWKIVLAALALFHFFLPFFLLLFRAVKTRAAALTTLAAMVFAAHILAVYWLVMPALHSHGVAASWLDAAAFLGIGGLWLGFFLSRLKAAALLPQHDPGDQFALAYES